MSYITIEKMGLTPNFIESEIGLVLKTAQVDNTDIEADEYGYKTVKSGTIYPANDTTAKGIIYTDIDVTDGERAASIITGGRIYKSKLPVTLDGSAETALKNMGIVFVDSPVTSRVIIDELGYTAGTTAFQASDIAASDDGSALKIVAIGDDNDTAIATVNISGNRVTATKVKAGKTQITCTVEDINGKHTDIVVPIVIS